LLNKAPGKFSQLPGARRSVKSWSAASSAGGLLGVTPHREEPGLAWARERRRHRPPDLRRPSGRVDPCGGPWIERQRVLDGDGFAVILQAKNYTKAASMKLGMNGRIGGRARVSGLDIRV
jgi:hypothetical protein